MALIEKYNIRQDYEVHLSFFRKEQFQCGAILPMNELGSIPDNLLNKFFSDVRRLHSSYGCCTLSVRTHNFYVPGIGNGRTFAIASWTCVDQEFEHPVINIENMKSFLAAFYHHGDPLPKSGLTEELVIRNFKWSNYSVLDLLNFVASKSIPLANDVSVEPTPQDKKLVADQGVMQVKLPFDQSDAVIPLSASPNGSASSLHGSPVVIEDKGLSDPSRSTSQLETSAPVGETGLSVVSVEPTPQGKKLVADQDAMQLKLPFDQSDAVIPLSASPNGSASSLHGSPVVIEDKGLSDPSRSTSQLETSAPVGETGLSVGLNVSNTEDKELVGSQTTEVTTWLDLIYVGDEQLDVDHDKAEGIIRTFLFEQFPNMNPAISYKDAIFLANYKNLHLESVDGERSLNPDYAHIFHIWTGEKLHEICRRYYVAIYGSGDMVETNVVSKFIMKATEFKQKLLMLDLIDHPLDKKLAKSCCGYCALVAVHRTIHCPIYYEVVMRDKHISSAANKCIGCHRSMVVCPLKRRSHNGNISCSTCGDDAHFVNSCNNPRVWNNDIYPTIYRMQVFMACFQGLTLKELEYTLNIFAK